MGGVRWRWAMAVIAPLVALGAASSPALASNPYSVFGSCPVGVPGVHFCVYGTITSGEFTIGKARVPIDKTIVLRGGALPTEPSEGSGLYYVVTPTSGGVLSKAELNVPGLALGLIDPGVTETPESVASKRNPAMLSTHNLAAESGPALTLPIRIHLKNPLLGNSCYIGSESHPIQLQLTTGVTSPPPPTKPIEGFIGEQGEEGEGGIDTIKQARLVDNEFSVPTAEGCGGFLDEIVDSKLGLGSKAGNNTAILSGEQKIATVEEVEKHL